MVYGLLTSFVIGFILDWIQWTERRNCGNSDDVPPSLVDGVTDVSLRNPDRQNTSKMGQGASLDALVPSGKCGYADCHFIPAKVWETLRNMRTFFITYTVAERCFL